MDHCSEKEVSAKGMMTRAVAILPVIRRKLPWGTGKGPLHGRCEARIYLEDMGGPWTSETDPSDKRVGL